MSFDIGCFLYILKKLLKILNQDRLFELYIFYYYGLVR